MAQTYFSSIYIVFRSIQGTIPFFLQFYSEQIPDSIISGKMSVSFTIAKRYIFSPKYKYLPSFQVVLAFSGIFLSVFTLITVLSVMNGFKKDFEKLIIGTRPHITIYPKDDIFQDYKKVLQEISDENEVLEVQPVINGEGIVSFNKKTAGIIIKGVAQNYFSKRPLLKKTIIGEFKPGSLVIGIEIANKMGIRINDKVTVISSKMRQTLFGNLPLHKTYTVTGFFKVDMYAYDSTMAFIDLPSATDLILNTEKTDAANALEIVLNNDKDTEKVYNRIIESGVIDGYITNWKNDNKSFMDAIATQTGVMFMILSLFLIVSGFIMFATLSSMVQQKIRSIAILQSFGMSKKEVMAIFVIFGTMIAVPAIILGVFSGCIFALNIDSIKNAIESATGMRIFDGAYYFLSYIPSSVDYGSVIKVCIFSVILCTVAVIIPAVRAGKVMPYEALRFE